MTTFANAPLVEIIAELRWLESSATNPTGAPFSLAMPGNVAIEDLFMRFGGLAFAHGYTRNERLMPLGMPVPVGQVCYRYRPDEANQDELFRSSLLQIGPGVFSANATPPYKSWKEFRTHVERGVQDLVHARGAAQNSFTHVSLRYIDCFTEKFLQGMSHERFLNEMLGFALAPPSYFKDKLQGNAAIETGVQFSFPLNNGALLHLIAHPGSGPAGEGILLTTSIGFAGETAPSADAVMAKLDEAQQIIHDAFLAMTEKLKPLMTGGADNGS